MTELFKAYHFEIDIPSDKTRIVPLCQLAQKYQFNALMPTLVSEKNIDPRINLLQCLNLDLDGDAQLKPLKERLEVELQTSAVHILEGNSYLTLDIHLWRTDGES